MWFVASGKVVPCNDRFPVIIVIALGASLAGSFLGGWATAQGHLPFPVSPKNAMKVSVGGGIGVLVIVLLLGHQLYKCDDVDGGLKKVTSTGQNVVLNAGHTENIPSSVTGAIGASSAQEMRQKLGTRDSLTLDSTILEIRNGAAAIVVNTLTLKNGSRIITNGNKLRIQALKVISENGAILSFPDEHIPSSVQEGQAGISGQDAGSIIMEIIDEVSGQLQIRLKGINGSDGARGRTGEPGSTGDRGNDAVEGFLECKSGGGDGGRGGRGGPGKVGFAGGNGGNGGDLIIRVGSKQLQKDVEKLFGYDLSGGMGGTGGQGGAGGIGGPGGQGGGGKGLCGGGSPGPPGAQGPEGEKGLNGQNGKDGTKIIQLIQ